MLKKILEFYLTILIPLLYLPGLIMIFNNLPGSFSFFNLASLLLVLFGLILWALGYFYLKSSFAVLPKAKKLVTDGVYKYFSHPIYLGVTLTFLGLSLATNSKPGLFYTLFIIIPLNIIRAKLEEKELLKKFGEKYREYKRKTFL